MIEYKLIRMKRKTISVSVSDDLTVIVKAPRSVSKLFIDDFVIRNEAWIENAILFSITQGYMNTGTAKC